MVLGGLACEGVLGEFAMGDYLRTTRECALDDMKPVLAANLRAHIELYELGGIEASALMCCETTSIKQKKGWFSSKPEVVFTGAILTPTWLLWTAGRENEKFGTLSFKLRDAQIQDYEKSPLYKMMSDTGITVTGLCTDATEVGSVFLGFGPEPASQKFRTLLRKAIAKND